MIGRDVVGAALRARARASRSARLVGRRRRAPSRPGSRRAGAWSTAVASASSATDDVDDAVGAPASRAGRRRRASTFAEPAALDHRRPAHAERDVLGRDDQVRAAGDHRVAGEAAPGDDGDPRHQARQPRPQREGARVERRDDRVVGVAGPPAAALGEEDGRQPHPLDQLEQPVLLAVAERALRAGQHRVVVGRRARAHAEQLAVDPRGAGDQAVGRACARSAPRARGGRAGRRSRSARTRRSCPGRPGRRRSRARSGRPRRGGARPRPAAPRPRSARGARAARPSGPTARAQV